MSVDTALGDIAIKHANYIKHVFANSSPTSFNAHVENKINDIADVTGNNNPFFGGSSFANRLSNAQYSNADFGVTENIAQTIYFSSAGNIVAPDVAAISMTKSLLAAPYHLRSLMMPGSSLKGTSMVAYKPNGKIQPITKAMCWSVTLRRHKRPKTIRFQVSLLILAKMSRVL